jgi:hypothetical protein
VEPLPEAKRKRLLVVLFVPSVERDGLTEIDQDLWVEKALGMLGRVFGGATAFPRAKGVWRDDEREGKLVRDNPVVVQCYMAAEDIEAPEKQSSLRAFCKQMGRETNQGEVGLVVDNEYLVITNFSKE